MKLKKIAAVMLSAAMVLSMAGCGGSSSESGSTGGSSSSGDSDTLTIWAWDEAFNIKAANEAKEIYLETHEDAEVEVVTMAQDDIVSALNTSLAAGTYDGLPDIVLIEDYRIQGYLNAYQDSFVSLSDVVNAADFAEYKTGVNCIGDDIYGVPFDSGVAGFFYRTDLITEAGYSTEDMQNITWEDYIEIGEKVYDTTGVQWCTLDPSDIGQVRMMLQSAGSWYTDEDGNVDIADNQALKDAIEIYKELFTSDIVKQTTSWDEFVGAFNNGDVASVVTGCWIAPSIKSAEDQSGKWAVAPFPKMANNADSVNASSIGGAGWYVLNKDNKDDAKEFLAETFASNVDLMNALAEDISLVSTINAAVDCENYSKPSEYFGNQEIFGDLFNWTTQVPSVNYGDSTYAIEDLMAEAVQQIVQGADADKTLESYQSTIEDAVGK